MSARPKLASDRTLADLPASEYAWRLEIIEGQLWAINPRYHPLDLGTLCYDPADPPKPKKARRK